MNIYIVLFVGFLLTFNSLKASSTKSNNTLLKHQKNYYAGIVYKFENGEYGLIENFIDKYNYNFHKKIIGDTVFCVTADHIKYFIISDINRINKVEDILKYGEIMELYDTNTFYTLIEIHKKSTNIKINKFSKNEIYENQFVGFKFSNCNKIVVGVDLSKLNEIKYILRKNNYKYISNNMINNINHLELLNEDGFKMFGIYKDNKFSILGYYLYP